MFHISCRGNDKQHRLIPDSEKRTGPAQISKRNVTVYKTIGRLSGMRMKWHLLIVTVVPVNRLSVRPCPAGTVKLLSMTVVHSTAAATSVTRHKANFEECYSLPSKELIVPTQGVVAPLTNTTRQWRTRKDIERFHSLAAMSKNWLVTHLKEVSQGYLTRICVRVECKNTEDSNIYKQSVALCYSSTTPRIFEDTSTPSHHCRGWLKVKVVNPFR